MPSAFTSYFFPSLSMLPLPFHFRQPPAPPPSKIAATRTAVRFITATAISGPVRREAWREAGEEKSLNTPHDLLVTTRAAQAHPRKPLLPREDSQGYKGSTKTLIHQNIAPGPPSTATASTTCFSTIISRPKHAPPPSVAINKQELIM